MNLHRITEQGWDSIKPTKVTAILLQTCLGAPETVLFLKDIHLDDTEPFREWLWSFSPRSE